MGNKMKLKCKTIKKIPLIASLAFLVGCRTTPEPKVFTSEADKYAYVKEYMRWYIKEQMNDNEIMGLSVALVDDQKVVWSEGFGYADKENGIKATPQTRYRAGSITKLFNAMAVMKLSEEGKMNIDKPLKIYLPEFRIKSRFGSTDNITPRNIMTHHSGLPSDWMDKFFATNPLHYTEYVNLIQNEYVASKPNTIFSYSNLGITLLGHSVEKVSGVKYANYIDKVLFRPMEMKNSEIKMALSGKDTSKSYKENKEINEYAMGDLPAGGLNTSVEELSHLAMMINAKGKYKNHQILKSSTLDKMFTVQNKNVVLDLSNTIGLGYFIDNILLGKKEPVYSHGGATMAHCAYFAVAPNSKLGVIIMSNSANVNVGEIANTFLKKAWETKTGNKTKKNSINIKKDSDFDGLFSMMMGKVLIQKKSKNKYIAHTEDGKFSLTRNKNNVYKAKYKLFGFIPIRDDTLEKVSFYTKIIEDKHIIVMQLNGRDILAGVKVETHKIPQKWQTYLGHYKVLNNFEPEEWKIIDVEFVIKKDYALIKTKYKSGENATTILKPINDNEAIIEGLGRGMKETIYFKDGIFHAQGLRFEKIEGENIPKK
jgi:CubicO group peptidase (beta-lactamase class C family)